MRTPLARLAGLYGVLTGYTDFQGRPVETSPENLVRVLRALGAPLAGNLDGPPLLDLPDLEDALRARRRDLWGRAVEPVLVAWDHGPCRVRLKLPESVLGETSGEILEARLLLEDGGERIDTIDLAALPAVRRVEVDGQRFAVAYVELPASIPYGYHRLALQAGSLRRESLLISSPVRAWQGEPGPQQLGLFAPVYALRTARGWGAGDLTDYEALLDWFQGVGGTSLGTLPLLAGFLGAPGEPFDPSPYAPASRLFWNEMYLDPERLPEMESSAEARRLLDSPEVREEAAALRALPLVDYRRQMALKRRILGPLARSFFASPPPDRAGALARFVALRPEVETYARFRASVESFAEPWHRWPARARDGDLQPGDFDETTRRYHLYVQWATHEQIDRLAQKSRAAGGGLYLDLPLGVHADGYDVWHDRATFALEASSGAPPDALFTGGQDWGFPPLHPERIRETGYSYLRACIQHHLRVAGALRIDHVLGLHRLYWIPSGAGSHNGVYVRYRSEEMYAILTLESARHHSRIIGEDLGTVPPAVRPALERHALSRLHVVQYELRTDPLDPLDAAPAGSVASLNTHDMPPFRAFLEGLDIEDRKLLGLLDDDQARWEHEVRGAQRRALAEMLRREGHHADAGDPASLLAGTLAHLRRGPARMSMINLEDLWLETEPQNVPGTSRERPNWRRRLKRTLEDFREHPGLLEWLRSLAGVVDEERA